MDPKATIDLIIDGLCSLDGYSSKEELYADVNNLFNWLEDDGFDPFLLHDHGVDLLCSLYWAFNDCYSGQWSYAYSFLSRCGQLYTPGMRESGPETDSFAFDMYESACTLLLK